MYHRLWTNVNELLFPNMPRALTPAVSGHLVRQISRIQRKMYVIDFS